MTQTQELFLRQKDSDSRIELDQPDYDRLVNSPKASIVDHYGSIPVVRIQ